VRIVRLARSRLMRAARELEAAGRTWDDDPSRERVASSCALLRLNHGPHCQPANSQSASFAPSACRHRRTGQVVGRHEELERNLFGYLRGEVGQRAGVLAVVRLLPLEELGNLLDNVVAA
jgi:hypothetical protein